MTKVFSDTASPSTPINKMLTSMVGQSVCSAKVFRGETYESHMVDMPLPSEHVLEICENSQVLMRITCTITNLRELVVGRLFSEGFIASIADLDDLSFNDDKTQVHIRFITRQCPIVETIIVPTYGVSGYSFTPGEERSQVVPIPWNIEDFFAITREFAKDTPMHYATGGAHSCYLAQGSTVLFYCEDLGRHNALDKVIGWALLHEVDLTHSIIFSSGRIPADMIGKVIRSGVPILLTKAVPTDLAVRMAHDAKLTLVCQAHPDSIAVFNDPYSEHCCSTPNVA